MAANLILALALMAVDSSPKIPSDGYGPPMKTPLWTENGTKVLCPVIGEVGATVKGPPGHLRITALYDDKYKLSKIDAALVNSALGAFDYVDRITITCQNENYPSMIFNGASGKTSIRRIAIDIRNGRLNIFSR